MARLANKPYRAGFWEEKSNEQFEDYIARTAAELEELQRASGGVDIDGGGVVGILLSFPVADGHAIYRVSKASPLTLQHVPYGDAWQIPAAHIRGIRKSDVIADETRRRGVRAIFRGGR